MLSHAVTLESLVTGYFEMPAVIGMVSASVEICKKVSERHAQVKVHRLASQMALSAGV